MTEVGFPVLELENFKSYREKTRFEWNGMASVVVGLNGSGKSSILDAIQFVCCFPKYGCATTLKYLQNRICNSQSCDPRFASDSWVEMVLIVDGEQSTFRRIVDYQNSVQRYCINGKDVKSNEYTKTLLRYNINPKANTFLIEQSCIENFATQTPKEFCVLFERLSGSSQFKAEYSRLDKKRQNLEDELLELKKQLNFYVKRIDEIRKTEAQWTKIRKLEEDYDRCQCECYFAKLCSIDCSIDNLVKEYSKLNSYVKATEKIKASTEEEIEALERARAEQDKILETSEAQMEDVKLGISNYSKKKEELEQKLEQNKSKMKKIANNLENAQKIVDNCVSNLKELEKEKFKVEEERELFISQSQRSSLNLNDEQNEEYLQLKSEAQKRCCFNINRISSLKREQSAISDKIDEYEERDKSLSQKIEKEMLFIRELTSKILNVTNKINETEQERNSFQSNINNLIEDINILAESKNQLLAEVVKTEKLIDEQKETKRDALHSKQKHQVLEKLKNHCNGVHDRLINLCEIGEHILENRDKLEIAITKIMGKKLDHIVVDKSEDAIKCIQFLKEYYSGNKYSVIETFIPMDKLEIKPIDETILRGEKNARLAVDVMVTEERYRDVVAAILGNAVICDTDEVASALSKKKRLNCVSYDGTFYKKDGTFSGGLHDLMMKSKKKWNEKKLQTLKIDKEEKISLMRQKMQDFESKKRQKSDLEIRIESLNKRLDQYLRPSFDKLQQELESKEKLLDDLKMKLANLKHSDELKELKNEFEIKTMELQKVEMENQQIENEIFSEFCVNYRLENIQQYESGDLNVHVERANKKRKFEDLLDKINNQIDYDIQHHAESTATVEKLQAALNTSKKENDKLKKQNDKVGKQFDEYKALFSKEAEVMIRKKIQELAKNINIKNKELKLMKKDLVDWNSSIRDMEVQFRVLESKKHKLLVECKVNNIDIPLVTGTISAVKLNDKVTSSQSDLCSSQSSSESIIDEKNVEIDYTKMSKNLKRSGEKNGWENTSKSLENELASLRSQVDEYLPKISDKTAIDVNEQAIKLKNDYKDKCQELSNIKYEFDEIKNKRKIIFEKFCESLETTLQNKFKALYQNSEAETYLLKKNPYEPYLDDIIFSCRIPKKRSIRMEELSGGEKTMCSIAFLSALSSVKPPPFLIFDELDAALDKDSIIKVAIFFEELKKSKQIIIISHHDIICVCADIVVGVNKSPITDSSYSCQLDIRENITEATIERNFADSVELIGTALRSTLSRKSKKSSSKNGRRKH